MKHAIVVKSNQLENSTVSVDTVGVSSSNLLEPTTMGTQEFNLASLVFWLLTPVLSPQIPLGKYQARAYGSACRPIFSHRQSGFCRTDVKLRLPTDGQWLH